MRDPKDLEQLFENLMCNNQVEDKGFTEKIVDQVSAKPRLAFVTNIYPIMGGLFGLMFLIFAKPNFSSIDLSFINRFAFFLSQEINRVDSFYASYGNFAMMGTLALVATYFVFEPEKN